jgi:hypothetical protein
LKPRTTGRIGVLALSLAVLASCGGRDGGEGPGEPAAGSSDPGTVTSGGTDTLVVVANLEEARLHLLPRDWQDLFHFRYAGRVVVLDPTTSPATAAFMESVLRAEARRTGVADAGFDWLRRLDRAASRYEADADDAVFRLRRGEAAFAILPSSAAGPLLERGGFEIVPMTSGADPDRWIPEGGSEASGDPAPPADWLAIWATEVRGKG